MTAPARQPVATTIWHCESNFLTCPNDHLLKFYETGYRADLRRVEGHAFFECKQCRPEPSYFFAVFVSRPSPMATCYEISKDSYVQWEKDAAATTLPTPEMLYQLRDPKGRSYNPHFKPRV